MRVLVAHNSYQQRGGEDVVFEQDSAMLEAAGVDVRRFLVDNDHIHGILAELATARSVISNKRSLHALLAEVVDFSPDVVQIHNFFPTLSPAAIDAIARRGLPIVLTLHNYRLICPGALLMRDGRPCEDCVGRTKLAGAIHGCYRRSHIGTALVGLMGSYVKGLLKKHARAITLVALSEFAKSRFVADGISAESIIVRGNVISDPGEGAREREARIVFLGRLSPEKGVDTLVRAARGLNGIIEIIGDGPERAALEAVAPNNVVFRGQLGRADALERLKSATALAAPSRSYETFSLVALEAMATGTPVLASDIGALTDLITHLETGVLLPPDDAAAWRDAMHRLLQSPTQARMIGNQARIRYLGQHSAKTGAQSLMRIYERAQRRMIS